MQINQQINRNRNIGSMLEVEIVQIQLATEISIMPLSISDPDTLNQ